MKKEKVNNKVDAQKELYKGYELSYYITVHPNSNNSRNWDPKGDNWIAVLNIKHLKTNLANKCYLEATSLDQIIDTYRVIHTMIDLQEEVNAKEAMEERMPHYKDLIEEVSTPSPTLEGSTEKDLFDVPAYTPFSDDKEESDSLTSWLYK